ncbi:hypothetical protein BKA62DRAFT_686586 [Auriculariales sp. MPI-PUGE-AT-0066]|nr:hypothetical protein BKA62DRAFT_686586 [Auriculariales sp. MPI-PUGE-AT-0066]
MNSVVTSASSVLSPCRRRQVGLLVFAHIQARAFNQLVSGDLASRSSKLFPWPVAGLPRQPTVSGGPQFLSDEWGMTFDARVRMLARRPGASFSAPSTQLLAPRIVANLAKARTRLLSDQNVPTQLTGRMSNISPPRTLEEALLHAMNPNFELGPDAPLIFDKQHEKGIEYANQATNATARMTADKSSQQAAAPITLEVIIGQASPEETKILDDLDAEVEQAIAADAYLPARTRTLYSQHPALPSDQDSVNLFLYRFSAALDTAATKGTVVDHFFGMAYHSQRLAYRADRPFIFQGILGLLVRAGRWTSVARLLTLMSEEGWLVDGRELSFIIQAMFQRATGSYASIANDRLAATPAFTIYEALCTMEAAPVKVPLSAFASCLAGLSRALEHPWSIYYSLERLVDRYVASRPGLESINRAVAVVMINAAGRIDRVVASKWLQRYRDAVKAQLTTKVHNQGKPDRPLQPYSTTPYTALIAAYVRAAEPGGALKVLSAMHEDGVLPPIAVYNLLLQSRPPLPDTDSQAADLAVERAARVAAAVPMHVLYNQSDAFTFAALWKLHLRWRVRLIRRTGSPQPQPRTLWGIMMRRGHHQYSVKSIDVSTRILHTALCVFLARRDYAAACVVLDALPRATSRTQLEIHGALWLRMRGEVMSASDTLEEIPRVQRLLDARGLSASWTREQEVRRHASSLTGWTDAMLNETGAVNERGRWLRAYVAQGGNINNVHDVIGWLLGGLQSEGLDALSFTQDEYTTISATSRETIDDSDHDDSDYGHEVPKAPLIALLHRAILASHELSIFSPHAMQRDVLKHAIGRARWDMDPHRAAPSSESHTHN